MRQRDRTVPFPKLIAPTRLSGTTADPTAIRAPLTPCIEYCRMFVGGEWVAAPKRPGSAASLIVGAQSKATSCIDNQCAIEHSSFDVGP